MRRIPVEAVPSQHLNIVLGQQNCELLIYQKSGLVYVDVTVSGKTIIAASLARNRVRLVRGKYLGFVGNLMFVDTQGHDDPVYSGFSNRWILIYLEEHE